MTHDDERRYHEQQNYAYEFRQRWRSKPDLSAILDAKAEREAKELKEQKKNDQRA